jgi:aryl-alcohol dehydrogenase-like predicted oxidoreductase
MTDLKRRLGRSNLRVSALGLGCWPLEWLRWFDQGTPTSEVLRRLDTVRDILTSNGRSLAQGALAWIWADSPRAVPLPGFRTVAHVQDTAAAMRHGPLTPAEHDEVERLLGRPARQ